ncbi:hypothetical protein T439DRAFT_323374 [Meredithblackwellia eburnea MCA 4105]
MLLRNNPSLSYEELAVLHSADPHNCASNRPSALVETLCRLLQPGNANKELYIAEQKANNLRLSLSHLTQHLSTTSSQLATSQASLSTLQTRHERELKRVKEERDALRALTSVWEGRWKEERRERERLMGLVKGSGRGKTLNERSETALVSGAALGWGGADGSVTNRGERAWRPLVRPTHDRHISHSSESSSSSLDDEYDEESHHPHAVFTTSTPSSTMIKPKLRTKQVVADLARELERVRREADHLLFARDEHIARMESEQEQRKKELEALYGSLDTLVFARTPASPLREREEDSEGEGENKGEEGTGAKDSSRAQLLEAEVRELERKVERLGQSRSSQIHEFNPIDEKSAREEEHLLTIQELNYQVSDLQVALHEVVRERDLLLDGQSRESETLAQLRLERDRLSHLLQTTSTSNTDLTLTLSTQQAQIEQVSERVRVKLLEQKGKIERCYTVIKELEDEVKRMKEEVRKERERRIVVEGKLRSAKETEVGELGKEKKVERSRSTGAVGAVNGEQKGGSKEKGKNLPRDIKSD